MGINVISRLSFKMYFKEFSRILAQSDEIYEYYSQSYE
jgi:hypothetical protein